MFDPPKIPLGPPWGGWANLFWARMIPASISICVQNFVGSQTVMSKKGAHTRTHARTHTRTHKGTLQLYIGPSIDNNSVCIRHRIQLQIMQLMFDAQVEGCAI